MSLIKKSIHEGLEFVYKTSEGKEVTAYIPFTKVIESLEDLVFEIITEPNCQSSSCTVNNFCECEPLDTDIKLKGINGYINY